MRILRKTVLIFYYLLLFIIIGCTEKPDSLSDQIQDVMREAKIPYTDIIHTEMVNNGLLVFYSDQMRYVSVGYIDYSPRGWKWVIGIGGASLDKGGHHLLANTGMPFYVDWGILTDPSISGVTVKGSPVKYITTSSGVRLWIHYPELPSVGKDIEYSKYVRPIVFENK